MKRKVLNALIIMIMLVVLIGVSRNSVKGNMNEAEEYDASVKEKYLGTVIQLTEENIEYFAANVPELKKYGEYIERESEGEASLTYHACAVEGGIPGAEDDFGYLVYVGEQWSDHRVNWDWFFVNANLSEVFYYDIVECEYLTLEEWRVSERYRDLE